MASSLLSTFSCKSGYQTISILPGVERVAIRSADIVIDPGSISEFEYHLRRSTLIGGAWSLVDPAFMASRHRDRVIGSLDVVEDILADGAAGGRFVHGHISSPHMPAVFQRDGSLRPSPFNNDFYVDGPRWTSLEDHPAAFADQLAHLNDRVLAMLRKVVDANPEAVIIVLSDHGSASHFQWHDLDSDLDERLSILFAARTPGETQLFPDRTTPINLYPTLFESYLGIPQDRLPDTT